jgi:hypothetical protein
MEVRKLEAVFGFKFDSSKLKEAIKSVNNFANNVDGTIHSLAKKMPLDVAVKFDETKAQQAQRQIADFSSTAQKALGVLAGYFAIQSVTSFFNSTVEGMANVARVAGYLGISTNALEELRYAAKKSGISVDTLDDSLKELQIRAVDAKSGTGEAAEAFQYLGMSSTDANGRMREPLELLSEVADRLKTLPTQSERIWVLDSMLGDQGAEMLKMLEGGSDGIKKMRHEAKELGVSLDKEAALSAKDFSETVVKLKAGLEALIKPLILALLPALKGFAHAASFLGGILSNIFSKTTILQTAFASLGAVLGVIAIKSIIAFAPFFGFALLIAGLILLIDDLWNAFIGGESVFLKLHKKARAFFEPIEHLLLALPKKIWDGMFCGISAAFDWIVGKAKALENLVPDFVKKGLFATIKTVDDRPEQLNNQRQLAPQLLPIAGSIQNHSNQSVSVAVNVKTGANVHEIGGEVSKAVRKELEKERQNAFMGIKRYAS